MQNRGVISSFSKSTMLVTAFFGFLMLFGAPVSRADHNTNCQRRIVRADHKLHEAAEHHGWRSREAERARRNLREARQGCYTRHHEWWDEHGRRWRSERDWDEHDHDEDHRWEH
jgi:hypothetical protein